VAISKEANMQSPAFAFWQIPKFKAQEYRILIKDDRPRTGRQGAFHQPTIGECWPELKQNSVSLAMTLRL
jgi:hypothetical protein